MARIYRHQLSYLYRPVPPTNETTAVLCFDCSLCSLCSLCSTAVVGVNLHVYWLLRAVDADYDSAFIQVHITPRYRFGGSDGRTIWRQDQPPHADRSVNWQADEIVTSALVRAQMQCVYGTSRFLLPGVDLVSPALNLSVGHQTLPA